MEHERQSKHYDESHIRPYEILTIENESLKRQNAILLKDCQRLKNIIYHQENSHLLTLQQMRLAIEAQESQIKASKSILSMQSNDILFDPGYCNFTRLHGSDEDVYSDIITTIAKQATQDRQSKKDKFACEECVSEAEEIEIVEMDKLVSSTAPQSRVPELPPRTKRPSSLGSKHSKSTADIFSASGTNETRHPVFKRRQWKKILQKSFSNSPNK